MDMYRQTSNIRHTLLDSKLVDHSDVVGASPVSVAPTTSSPGSNEFGKGNCKTRPESIKFLDLVLLILEIWR